MARPKGSGKGLSKPVSIRLPAEEEAFYRSQANKHGMSLSAFLTRTLLMGVVAENVQDVEQRLKAVVASISDTRPASSAAALPEDVLLSIYTSEYLLTAIVEARDVQQLYAAQDKARARLKRE